ncbi:hypothetical protein LZ30DRAFT_731405 [Colletotrichum cereale]|nr:hypothetical protein LZ30DRAFT_731405 [Colletotrichum cereale]
MVQPRLIRRPKRHRRRHRPTQKGMSGSPVMPTPIMSTARKTPFRTAWGTTRWRPAAAIVLTKWANPQTMPKDTQGTTATAATATKSTAAPRIHQQSRTPSLSPQAPASRGSSIRCTITTTKAAVVVTAAEAEAAAAAPADMGGRRGTPGRTTIPGTCSGGMGPGRQPVTLAREAVGLFASWLYWALQHWL